MAALEASLYAKDHVKVPLSGTKWAWSPEDSWPPISAVLRAPLYALDEYEQLRARLRSPCPSPNIVIGGAYITVDIHASRLSPPPAAPASTEPSEPTTPSSAAASTPAATSTATPSQAAKKAKRQAQAVGKTGLIHVTSLAPGISVPGDIQDLQYRLVILEVADEEHPAGVHAMLQRLLLKDVPILLCGNGTEVTLALQTLQYQITDQMHTTEMALHRPAPPSSQYRFHNMRLVILSKAPVPYKVQVSTSAQCVHDRTLLVWWVCIQRVGGWV